MSAVHKLITDHLDIWTAADTEKKSGRGRASGNANSVYGIKKLRELILELAVRGKLVPQDPSDEPATKLLKRIMEEKAELIGNGLMRKEKALPEIKKTETPHSLPVNWEWVRFGSIAQHNSGKTLDNGRNNGTLRDYITTSNLYWGRFELENVRQMPIREEEFAKCVAKKGDLLICEGGEAGRAAVWFYEKEICFQNHIHRARFYCDIDPYYGYRFFEKINATGEINQHRKGVAISNMSGKALSEIYFPLPPLAEQHRIVSKVDELMALCDQLEAQHNNAADAHEQLVSHLLSTLTQSQDAEDFNANWQRIATHFDTLFTTESSIDALKQTLLQLAVMGKLVPQDPNDEPASELLKRIQDEKAKLVGEGKIKKDKLQTVIDEDEKKFEIPKSWEWCRIGFFASLMSGKGFNASEYSSNGVRLFQIANVSLGYTKWEIENFLPAQYLDLHPDLVLENGDVLVALNRPILNGLMKVCIISNEDLPAILYQRVGKFSFFKNTINTKYFYYFLQSELFINHLEEQLQGSDQPFINQSQLIRFICTIPPSNEQRRIVAKVDELMALCAQLKSRINDGRISQQKLTDILVETAAA
jgi:type I restriction enzyme S subunit